MYFRSILHTYLDFFLHLTLLGAMTLCKTCICVSSCAVKSTYEHYVLPEKKWR